ncbi:GTPase domain-containing protein [Corynebacterium neomassiliense]|uniref:GTPase domain-containing protein n=1 Tax=Corynebacterium neomassiliense TaxID=2079482 RepID=UPI00102FE0C6|nr:GTPase domain-containing protein [Corynebacterium neomassiliense]
MTSDTERALAATVEYFRSSGDTTAADALQATVGERRSPGTVCLYGRAGSGRSTLLNSLLRSPAVLPATPAGVGVVTASPVTVDAEIDGTPVTLVDLPAAEVSSSGPDGTAGLFFSRADIVLYVVDAHIPLDSGEVAEIRDILRLAPRVEVVVTGRDRNLRSVGEVVSRDREILAGVPGEVPGDAQGDPVHVVGEAVPLHVISCLPGADDSGLNALRDQVVARVADRTVTPPGTAVRQARIQVARELERQRLLATATEEHASGHGEEATDQIDGQLRLLSDLPRANRTFLTDRIAAARTSALTSHADAMADLQRKWRHFIDVTRPTRIFDDPAPVISRLGSELSALKQDALGSLMRAVRGEFLEYTAGAGRWEAVTGQIASSWSGSTGPVPDPTGSPAPERARLADLVTPSLLTVSVSGGGALAYAATLLPGVGGAVAATGGLAVLPVVAAAGTWLAVNLLHNAAGRGRRNLRTWLDETVAAARRDLNRDLDEVYHRLRPVVLTRFETDITEYVTAERRRLTEARAALLAGEKNAADARDLAERRVAHLEKLGSMLR